MRCSCSSVAGVAVFLHKALPAANLDLDSSAFNPPRLADDLSQSTGAATALGVAGACACAAHLHLHLQVHLHLHVQSARAVCTCMCMCIFLCKYVFLSLVGGCYLVAMFWAWRADRSHLWLAEPPPWMRLSGKSWPRLRRLGLLTAVYATIPRGWFVTCNLYCVTL